MLPQGYEGPIRSFVVENFLFGDADGLQDTDLLLENRVLDSTGVLELVAYLEETFQIEVEDEELVADNLNSIAFAAGFVARKLAER